MPTKTNGTALERPKDALPRPPPGAETPVMKATRSMLARMDDQRAEISRLASAVRAALA